SWTVGRRSLVEAVGGEHVVVRPHAVSAPHSLAVLDVIGADVSADAELAAAHADDDLVLVDMRCRGHGGADLRVSVLGLPDLLAALGVQRDQMAVELAQEDFAVSEGEPTVDVVAAGDG